MAEKKEKRYVSDNIQLMAEWDWEKNAELGFYPDKLTCGSGKKVWWKCTKGHKWQSVIASRNSGCRCPYCAGVLVSKGETDLETINPALAMEWNYEKNNGLTPSEVMPNSDKKVWWICKNGHDWQATIASRNSGCGCPYCAGIYAIKGENDLKTINPALALEWDWEKNGELTPEDVTAHSHKKVWWKCKTGHSWQAYISKRSIGQNCPFCSGKQSLQGYNDLSTTNPELISEWDFEKNDTPIYSYRPMSNKKVWWICDKGHSWNAAIAKRVSGEKCPVCQGKKIEIGYNDLATTHPALAIEWDYERNEGVSPSDFSKGSDNKVWWICKRNHSWKAAISSRASGVGCPHCTKELQSSFPEKAIYFYIKRIFPDAIPNYHSDQLKSFELDVFIPSLQIGVEYDGDRWHRSVEKDLQKNKLCTSIGIALFRVREPACPVLSDGLSICIIKESKKTGLDKTIAHLFSEISKMVGVEYSVDVDLEKDGTAILELLSPSLKENSIQVQNPNLAKEWDYQKNGVLLPGMVTPGSEKKVWWICKRGHSYRATIASRAGGRGCPICSGKKVLRGFNDFESHFPYLAKDWDYEKNGKLTPMDVMPNSSKTIWWKCSECGSNYSTSIYNRTRGYRCPVCKRNARKTHSVQYKRK